MTLSASAPLLSPIKALGGSLMIDRCTASATALTMPGELVATEWATVGARLAQATSAQLWWWGDWWAFGEHRYGDRSAVVLGHNWSGPRRQNLMDLASVCRAFETSRRREALSFQHHREVAALPAEEADVLLDWAEEAATLLGKPHSTRELRDERYRRELQLADTQKPLAVQPAVAVVDAIEQHSARQLASLTAASMVSFMATNPANLAMRQISMVDVQAFVSYVPAGHAPGVIAQVKEARRQLGRLIKELSTKVPAGSR